MKVLLKFSFMFLAVLAVSGIIFAAGSDKDPLADIKPLIQKIERDCPACGYNWRTKSSNNKPSKAFEGVFESGTKCPVCDGKSVVYDYVDWNKGEVRTTGATSARPKRPIEDPKARFAQEKLLSERGAKVAALRNAVAAVMEVRLFGDKKIPDSYRRTMKGFVHSFKVTDVKYIDSGTRPGAIAKITIPLWGINSVTGSFFDTERKRYVMAYGGPKTFKYVDAVNDDAYDEDTTIVIDLRGTDFKAHLFPTVEEESGNAVYNMTLVAKSKADTGGVVSYLYMGKDEKSFDDLKSELEAGLLDIRDTRGVRSRLALVEVDPDTLCASKKKKKKRIVIVRGKSKKTKDRTKVIVSGEDAKKMAEAEKKGAAKKNGNVVIITDSRIAGKQGMVVIKTEKRFAQK